MMNTILLALLTIPSVYAEGYYCPYTDLGFDGTNDLLYDYYQQEGNTWVRIGETGRQTRESYCNAKGDLSIHSDAGQVKCEDSQGTCTWTGSSCEADPSKQPDCFDLCETILNGGGLACLGSSCPGGGDRSVIYAICDGVAPPTDTEDTEDTEDTMEMECTWAGHCAGDACVDYNDCDGEMICIDQACGLNTGNITGDIGNGINCGWIGHCNGDACVDYNDCDGVLVCNQGICGDSTEQEYSTEECYRRRR